jgi:hypothetical protein
MFHAISGWLTRHARRNRQQLARDNEFAAMNGWHARPVNRLGTWAYRDPRFTSLRASHAGQAHAPAPPSWTQAALGARIRNLPLTIDQQAGRRCSR